MVKKNNGKSNPAIEEIIRQSSSPENGSITTEQGLQAARAVAEKADEKGVDYALAGGIAMHLYGFTRATTDVDLIASDGAGIEASRGLGFGGETYQVRVSDRLINVDWIVRDDDQREVYEAALADAIAVESLGWKIISPEWMVIIKHLAGRGKDHLDLLWLLRRDSLVDRGLVEQHIRKLMGKYAYWVLRDLEAIYLEADVMRQRDEADEGTARKPAG